MPQLESSFNLEILDHLPQGMFILRQDGTVAFWNHCLEEWTGVSKSAAVGHPLVTHFPQLGTPKYTSRFEPLFSGGPPVTFASQFHPQFLPCTLPNGQPRIQQTIAKTIWNEPTQEWQALVIIQDISDLHRQVAESQRLRKQAQAGIVERKKAEATMIDQNRLLTLDSKVGQIINQTQELQPLLQQCTQAIVTHLNATFARIWTLHPNQQILELQASAGLYTHLDGPHGRVPVGQFKIGKIAAEKKPHLTNSVIGDPRVSDQEWAKREGMVAFAGYPLLKGQEVVGVMALFAKHPLTSLTLESLKMVGDRITTAIDRQQTRQAHQDLFLRHERILASAGEGIFGLDLEGRTTFVNPAAAKMLGYELVEIIGIPMHSTVHHTRSDGAPYPRETCPMYAAFKDGAIHQIEDEILWCKDGRSIPIDYTSRPIHDEQGQIVGAVVTFKDITERKQMEKARTYLQRAIDQAIEGLALLDQQGKYTYINQAHAEMYGYTSGELVGQSWKMLYSKDQIAYIDARCFPCLRNSGKWQGELVGLRKDGTSFPVEISLSLLLNKDQTPAGLVCTCRDITERQRAEILISHTNNTLEQQNSELAIARDQALSAARAKSEFLATMSHEIRTPLNGVIGMTDLLLGTDLDADQHEMLETVKHSGEFLLTLLNDILDFSKIDAGKLDLEVIDFHIRTAVDEVLDILAEQASQKNLELIALVYATTPLQVRGDPGRIRQILFNLIGNAIKFTQGGEIVVDVSVVETTTDTTTLRFAVTDTGIGIDPEVQGRLFELFTQADSSTTRKFGGTGLGLAICKQLITLMHGEIGVISEQGHGSTFWFAIPFAVGPSLLPTAIPTINLQNRRVCIVETHDTIRFLLQHYVQSWGMVCEVAQNGEDGLVLLHERATQGRPFDIALLDHRLSDTVQEDGFSLATRIRHSPSIATTPLILLTALGKRGEGKVAEQSGCNGYLTKPVRHAQLQECLTMVLGAQPSSDPSARPDPTRLITRHSVVEIKARTQVRILLAEDNVVNQKVAIRMLQKLDYQVDVTENGRDAIEAITRTSYDLVLMDCQMPEMDGLEATRKIREAEILNGRKGEVRSPGQETPSSEISPSSLQLPQCSRVPIIALTANALSEDRQACLDAGMDDFLSKPVRLEELSTMITKWLPLRPTSEGRSRAVPENSNGFLSSPASLDHAMIQDLKSLGGEDDPGFFLTVVDQFLSDLPRHLEGIKQAVERHDSEALVKAAHACKGSSRSMGAILLADISYELEMMGREGTMGDATVKFAQWLQEKDSTVLALQQERIQHSASSPSTPHF